MKKILIMRRALASYSECKKIIGVPYESEVIDLAVPESQAKGNIEYEHKEVAVREGAILYHLVNSHERKAIYSPFDGEIVSKPMLSGLDHKRVAFSIRIRYKYVDVNPYIVKVPPAVTVESRVNWEVGVGFLVDVDDMVCRITTDDGVTLGFFAPIKGIVGRIYALNGTVKPFQPLFMIKPFNAAQLNTYRTQYQIASNPSVMDSSNLLFTMNKSFPSAQVVDKKPRPVQITTPVNMSLALQYIKLLTHSYEEIVHGIELSAFFLCVTSQVLSLPSFVCFTDQIKNYRRVRVNYQHIAIGMHREMETFYPVIQNVNEKTFFEICEELLEYRTRLNSNNDSYGLSYFQHFNESKFETITQVFTIATDLNSGSEYVLGGVEDSGLPVLRFHSIHEELALISEDTISPAPHLNLAFEYDLRYGIELQSGPEFLKEMKSVLEDPYKKLALRT